MTEQRIDLSGLTILALDDRREELKQSYTATELVDLFVSEWVPYLECQKCGRHTYCKFTEPHPYPQPRSVGRLAEIRCGVVAAMINNYVRSVFPLLEPLSPEELQDFLDGSFHLVRFVYQVELQIGHMIDEGVMESLGKPDYRALFFGITAHFRRHLDKFAASMRGIEAFRTVSTVILTEGPSEKAFLERLKESRLLWFIDLDVESYYGQSSRGPTRLQLLASRLRRQGYELFVQGDCDGRVRDIFEQLVKQGIVKPENTFAFEVDFETSFPLEIIFSALTMLEMLDGVTLEEFEGAMAKRAPGQSVVELIERKFHIEVNKIELADALGMALNENILLPHPDDSFWSSEAGRFLDKIRRLP